MAIGWSLQLWTARRKLSLRIGKLKESARADGYPARAGPHGDIADYWPTAVGRYAEPECQSPSAASSEYGCGA